MGDQKIDMKDNQDHNSMQAFKTILKIHQIFTQNKFRQIKNLPKIYTQYIDLSSLDMEKLETDNKYKQQMKEINLSKLHAKFYTENLEGNNKNDLIFFAAASFEIDKLKELIADKVSVNQTRYENTVMMFVIKFTNCNNAKFLECMQTLIEEGRANVNRCDVHGKTPIHFFMNFQNDASRKLVQLFLDRGAYVEEHILTKLKENSFSIAGPRAIDKESQIYILAAKNKGKELNEVEGLEEFVRRNDCENTLLQLVSKRGDNFLGIVKLLLKKGADPNLVTEWNKCPPLELAVLNNNPDICKFLLQKANITQEVYDKLVQNRNLKSKVLPELLNSNKLKLNFEATGTKNTPLHLALMYGFKDAAQKLMKRGASLLAKNATGTSCLELMDEENLRFYFDSCIKYDNYTTYFADKDYKILLNFNGLIEKGNNSSELYVSHKIGKIPKLQQLLAHPLPYTFLSLKWKQSKYYFYPILVLQLLVYLFLSFCFYYFNHLSIFPKLLCYLFIFLNILLKVTVFLVYTRRSFHGIIESLLGICTIFSVIPGTCHNNFRPFVFILMAISLLLIAGYHPKLSKWSIMLQTVLKTFLVLSMFFSLFIFAFGAGFHVLVEKAEDTSFDNFIKSAFKTYIMMTTGDLDTEGANLGSVGFKGYLLFVLFATIMLLVIMNFWTGVAVSDIEKIEKDSEINSFRNVIVFLRFIDKLFTLMPSFVLKLGWLPQPLLFGREKIGKEGYEKVADEEKKIGEQVGKEKENKLFSVDFYINRKENGQRKKQIQSKLYPNFPKSVDEESMRRIREHYYQHQNVQDEAQEAATLKLLQSAVNEQSRVLKELQTALNDMKKKT